MVYEYVTDLFVKVVLLSSGPQNIQSVNFSFVRIVMDSKLHLFKRPVFFVKNALKIHYIYIYIYRQEGNLLHC